MLSSAGIHVKVVHVRVGLCKCEKDDFTLAADIPKRYQIRHTYIQKSPEVVHEDKTKIYSPKTYSFAEP